MYGEAFRLAPRLPLVSLCLCAAHLGLLTSRSTPSRHQVAARAVAFLGNYERLRREGAGAGASAGEGSGEQEDEGEVHDALDVDGAGDSDGEGESAAGAGAVAAGVALSVPLLLPPGVVEAEVCFNVGRLAQQLGLASDACAAYEAALRQRVPARFGSRGGLDIDCRREAALNLALILRQSGAEARAAEVTRRFLTYE